MGAVIRTFAGVPVRPSAALLDVCQQLAKSGRVFKPVDSSSMHVTVKFLGDTRRDQVSTIVDIIRRHAANAPAAAATVRGLGAFPSPASPRVVWAGLTEVETLRQLASLVASDLVQEGFPEEQRAYTPHVTLGRVKLRRDQPVPDRILELLHDHADTDFGPAAIDRIVLYQSTLGADGPVYREVESVAMT